MMHREQEALQHVERKLQDAADAIAQIVVDPSLPGLTREFAQKLMIKVAKIQVDVEERRSHSPKDEKR